MSRDRRGVSGDADWSEAWKGAAREDVPTGALGDAVAGRTTECVIAVDDDASVAFADGAVRAVLGYEPSALVGEPLAVLFSGSERQDHLEAFGSAVREDTLDAEWTDRELRVRRRDDREIPVSVTVESVREGGDAYYVWVIREVSARTERRERYEHERAFVQSMFDAIPDVIYALDQQGRFLRWNERLTEVTGYSNEEIETLPPLELVPPAERPRVAEAVATVIEDGETRTVETELVTADGRLIPHEITGAPLYDGDDIVGQTGVARDITERKRREARLQRLDDLNTVIRSVVTALIDATTREEIERSVAAHLVEEGAYAGAVVGRFDESIVRFEESASAGVVDGDVEALIAPEGDLESSLAAEAVRTKAVRTAADLPSGLGIDVTDERSIAAVPLVADDQSFGVLLVVSGDADVVGERERSILAELGQVIGNAIQASLTRQLLYADAVTEIELATTDADLAFVRLSEAVGCRVDLRRVLSFGDDYVFYEAIDGASVEEVTDYAESDPAFSGVEHLGGDGDEHLFEFTADSGTVTELLTAHGARLAEATAIDGRAELRLQLAPDADARSVIADVTETFPETELVARRQVERDWQSPLEFTERLSAEMTEKQRAALETAYFAGYFEWPSRTSNAEDVAETLDIAPQTFHQHLRIALEKLLTAVFDAEAVADAVDDGRT